MKPFILQFKESATLTDFDFSKIAYDPELNLNVDIQTGNPAIDVLEMGTETGTKVLSESSDSDANNFQAMLGTEIITLTGGEGVQSDRDRYQLQMLMATNTNTRVIQETPDKDF
ncbi:hypothetical protein [Pedobacter sp. UBA5917]|jgi:hypothetical protein|uniref:hypothetical protein n=1 Tax=Pedobacter sp. UBA5917 TaxID=1947061 RepID=UPI0025ECD69F|nr:hypothetical protein [Pedobacter sp. UBA5917]